ncbi:hypothetical protein BX666DRAFT_2030320 [Dichotomocladium elegans]|nr:hypothetical protein BX666DRAFT_2030320 [Dichotomocladium elegans]
MANVVEATRAMVRDYMAQFDPSHDMEHVERVVRLALKLGRQAALADKVDLVVIELAALLHDVGDAKYETRDGQQPIEPFLIRHGYPVEKARLVVQIVRHVGFRKELGWKSTDPLASWRETCLELHAVQDADKLDAIGGFGILRCAAFSGARNIPLHTRAIAPIHGMDQAQYEAQKNTGTAINHFHEKLFRLPSMMRTPVGKEMARKRERIMRDFVQQVEDEYEMVT